ncbi:hypothetical protein AB8Z38_22910 [Bradyrhizobium sp. LLZ17]|uniref:Uncharacterized protein n=1 Tax=Bradyrhizobium sp. LLZ17 TaxID=3239388 RepID=A0AB39XCK2_9BRAD
MDRVKAARERRIEQLAIEIERYGGDAFAADFLRDMISQSPREGQQTIRKLAAEIEAWRRARRIYRQFFVSWASAKRAE